MLGTRLVRIADRSAGSRCARRSKRSSIPRCLRQDLPEGVGGHAEAGRHAHALDPPQLTEACSLPADHGDLRPIDLPQMQHVTPHQSVPSRRRPPVA